MEVKVPIETKDWPTEFEYGTVYPKQQDMKAMLECETKEYTKAILANGLHVIGTEKDIKDFCNRRKTVIDRLVDNYEMFHVLSLIHKNFIRV